MLQMSLNYMSILINLTSVNNYKGCLSYDSY
jgi:hypothetical protein